MKHIGKMVKTLVVTGMSLFLLFALASATTAQCTLPPSGLIGWWPGDGNARDIIGGNDGTLMGGATFAAGKVGQAFGFDGVSGAMTIGQPLSLIEGTVEFWVNPGELTAEPGHIATDAFFGSTNGGANRAPTFAVRRGRTFIWEFGNLTVRNTNIPLPVGQWHHLAMTWRRNPDGTHSVMVYADGQRSMQGSPLG